MMNMTTDLYPNTRAAYQVWLQQKPSLNAQIDRAETNEQVDQWERDLGAAWEKVQDAAYEDTKHINGLHHCRLLTEKDIMIWLGVKGE